MSSTRETVLEALRDAGAHGVSGEEVARGLDVSRVAVAKHVAGLRDAGYRIESLHGRGYRLLSVPDAPLPAEVRHHLRSGLWVRLEGGGATGSTNVDAARLARDGAPHGTAVLASSQTGGKGRLGRAWESPEGGVYVSAVLRPPLPPAGLTGTPLAVAWGVAAEVGERFGVSDRVRVKWPNDIRIAGCGSGAIGEQGGGGKLAGILLEISGEADRTEWVVAGVGVNANRPAQPAPGAAYLSDAHGAPGRVLLAELAAAVLDGIARGYDLLLAEGLAAVTAAIEPLDAVRGEPVVVRDIEGRVLVRGRAEGIDGLGRLLVRDGGSLVPVTAGDVTLAGSTGAGSTGGGST